MAKFVLQELEIPGVALVRSDKFSDERGYFMETWSKSQFASLGLHADFVQDNQSLSRPRGTLRGLHFQREPHAQAKLIRVVTGAIFDVAVDLRPGSPTFGQWCGAELTSEDNDQLFIPRGFAHGFLTLHPDTIICYRVEAPYAPQSDSGIAWDDADIGVKWPVAGMELLLSDRDRRWPTLKAYREALDAVARTVP